jgi:succinoglycan biosynthesis protein ExoM
MSATVLDQPVAMTGVKQLDKDSKTAPDRRSPAATSAVLPRLKVAIAAPTLGRPDGLRRLLDGLSRLTFERLPEPEITVVIVDNSATPAAAPIVDAYRPLLRWPIVYHHEPRRGLVHARNAQLDAAPATADWLAMIDDDEVPAPEWLDSLLAVAMAHDAHFVAGPVVPLFLEAPPAWAIPSRFFEAGPFVDGAPIGFLYTGNVLVSLQAVRAAGWRFELAFNDSGGEDEHFFDRALQSGLRAVSAADACVFETIPPSRTTVRWVLRRYFRMGTTTATIDRMRDPSLTTLARRGTRGCALMLIGLMKMMSGIAMGKLTIMKGVSDFARGAGSVVGLFGVRYGEYRPVNIDT